MKKRFVVLLLFIFIILNCAARENEGYSAISVTLAPYLGYYKYIVDITGGEFYDGGLNLLLLEYEYRILPAMSICGFTEATGHLYQGHEDSSSAISRIWGLVNIKGGIGLQYVFFALPQLELGLGAGISYVLYIQNFDDTWPGFGLNAKISALFALSPAFSLGLTACLNDSTHAGGPVADEPGVTRYPFEIIELSAGITARFRLSTGQ